MATDNAVPMTAVIRAISSMATRQLLAELAADYARESGVRVEVESVGGVDAAKRVAAGEPFDAVILGSDAIDKLLAAGHAVAGTRTDIVRSATAIAVKAGAPHPDIGSEEAVKQAVLAARRISYSTGPSGVALALLFDKWGISAQIGDRIVTPPPGTPVGTLVAKGEVELGFQQLSELIHLQGIDILGTLPEAIQVTTIFSGALCAASKQPEAVRAFLGWLASPVTAAAKQRQGMQPA
jgi:molybdate transport system substrate-binding protein